MKNKCFKLLISLNAAVLFCSLNTHAERLLVEDFNMTRFVNYLGGSHNTWSNNPSDKTIGCTSAYSREDNGFALKLEYDIDSSLTYMYNAEYILDYSAYAVDGLINEIPHTGFCGYYFMLNNADLTKYRYLIFFIKGDEQAGYTRKMQVELKTPDQSSGYIIEGITNKWKKIVVPLSVFEKIDNWKKIDELTFIFNEYSTEKTGVMYVDNIYFAESPGEVSNFKKDLPSNKSKPSKPHERLYMSYNAGINYRFTPETQHEIFPSAGVVLEGNSGRLMGRVATEISSLDFGQSAYLETLDKYPYSRFTETSPSIKTPTLQFKIRDLHSLVDSITLGNIFIGASSYILSPYWGWRGIGVSGRIADYDHSTFLIKRSFNSFSAGNRSLYYIGNTRIKLVSVYDYETADMDTSSDLDIRPVSNEFSWHANTLHRFLNSQLNIELNYGGYAYKKLADADYTTPATPAYSKKVSSNTLSDSFYMTRLFLDGLFLCGNKFMISYREVGTDFIPKYRQEPGLFEEVKGDQKGYTIRAEQWYHGMGVNVYYDNLLRLADSGGYGKVFNAGLKYLGPLGMELALNREFKREKYTLSKRDFDYDRSVESIIITGAYNFLYPITPGVRFPMTLSVTFKEDKTLNKRDNSETTDQSVSFDLNYRLASDFGFAVTYDTNDNNFNLFINGNF
ncbi:hypothetical protein ACFLR5_01450 [Elusimicrobiota bacterium]